MCRPLLESPLRHVLIELLFIAVHSGRTPGTIVAARLRRLTCFGLRHCALYQHPPYVSTPLSCVTPPPCFSRSASRCAALGSPLQARHLPRYVACCRRWRTCTPLRLCVRGPSRALRRSVRCLTGSVSALDGNRCPVFGLVRPAIPAIGTNDARAAACTDHFFGNLVVLITSGGI